MTVSIKILDSEVMQELKGIEYRLRGTRPLMQEVAKKMQASIKLNFTSGKIRPKSKRVLREGGETLRLTGRLMNSITAKGYMGRAVAGTNVVYALAQQFGYKGEVKQQVSSHRRVITQAFGKAIDPKTVMVKAHGRTIRQNLPARPFMEIDPGDLTEIKNMIMTHVINGGKK